MRGDKDLERELQAHLELDAEERRDSGSKADEARHAAKHELGNVTQIKEVVYEMHPLAVAERWWKDLRYAVRSLRRNPGFAGVAILSLALGIGAATAIFTIADRALLRALPVEKPGELRLLNWQGEFIGGSSQGYYESFSYPAFLELVAARPSSLAGMAARFRTNVAFDAGSGVGRAEVAVVSGSYFEVMGVRAALGRMLTPEDDEELDAEPWVVLTHDYWRDRLGEDPEVVGTTVRVNSFPMTVIGVAQPGFRGLEKLAPTDVFVPLQMNGVINPTYDLRNRRNAIWLNIVARIAPGNDPQQAASALQVAYGGILRRDLEAHSREKDRSARYVENTLEFVDASQGLQNVQERLVATPLHILSAMVGLLLLITCVNVANLLMIRAAKRAKEIALRSSLGASRMAVIRLVLSESLRLSVAGAALGLLFARFGAAALVRMVPADFGGMRFDGSLDWRVAAFAAGLALLTALAFGLGPAFQTTRGVAAKALKNEASSVSLSRAQTRTRRGLIVAQVSLPLILLAVAGLFGKSLNVMFEADSGFDVDRLLAFSINPSEHNYAAPRIRRLATDLRERLTRIPGVESASAAAVPILAGGGPQNTISAEGYQPEQGENMQAYANYVLPGFFGTTGVRLLAGRDFTERDVLGGPLVVIVNEAFANRFFGSPTEAVGRHSGFGLGRVLPFELIGVVADHKGTDMREEAFPRTYWPLLQQENPDYIAFYLNTRDDPASLLSAAIGAVRELDPELAVFHARTVERQLEETHFIERLFALLSATFAVLATLIAAVGLYGVAAFSVARRTREIGIRVALGALRGGVFRMVLREALGLAVLGVLIGLPLAMGVGKLVEAQLYGVPAIDLGVTTAAVVALLAAATLAGYLPARRAMQISPIAALRHE
jgi:predicted permease